MTEFSKQPNTLSRRDFLKLSGLTAAWAALVAACGGNMPTGVATAVQPPTPTRLPPTEPQKPATEIKGPVPGDYSPFIKQHELQPTIFTEYDLPETRKNMTIDFLKRYRDALKDKQSLRGSPLTAYKINTSDNYPISIPNSVDDNWTIYDVANTLITEIENGKTEIEYNPKQPIIAGTRNSYENIDGKFSRKTKISLGEKLMLQGFFHESDNYYTRPTDTELAIILLHEYAHALQDEMFLAFLTNKSDALAGVGLDGNKVASWITQKADEKNNEMRNNLSPDQLPLVKFNEAQANTVAYYFLYHLNQLNNSGHYPGTRRIDPYDIDVESIKQLPGQQDYVNLYKTFLEQVINTGDSLSLTWLIEAGK